MNYIPLCVVPPTVCTIALILRGIARYKSKISFGLDDFFACLGTAAFWGYSATSLWNALHNPATTSAYDDARNTLIAVYVDSPLTMLVITCAKLSTLFLYKRIFWPKPWFKLAVNLALFVSVTVAIALMLAAFFRCSPISAAWNPLPPVDTKCIGLVTLTEAFAIPSLITEAGMIVLAMFAVHGLNLPLRIRISVSLIFAIGFFVVAITIVWVLEIVEAENGNEGAVQRSTLWGPIQMCSALCVASLLTYRGLVPESWNVWPALREWYSDVSSRRSRSRRTTSENGASHDCESNIGLKLHGYDMHGFSTARGGVEEGRDGNDQKKVPAGGISVTHSVDVSQHAAV